MKLSSVLRRSLTVVFVAVASAAFSGCAVDESDDVGTGDEQNVTELSGRFETFEGIDGQYYFHLIAGNGERILQSEGYTTLQGARKGIASVKKNAVNEERYDVLEAVDGDWYFNVKAGNHQIIGTSETYATKSNATRAKKTVRSLVIKELREEAAATGGAHFDVFRGTDKQYYFNLRAANGQILLQSEGYTKKASALNGVESVRNNGKELGQYEILEANNGQFYFRIEAKNYRIIARGEMYASEANAERGVETVAELLQSEAVADAE